MSDSKNSVSRHYDAVTENYHEQYQRKHLFDLTKPYPANYFRLQLMLNTFVNRGLKRVIEVGVGEGTPLATLGSAGIEVWGFDISDEMVGKSKLTMERNGMDPGNIFWGDIADSTTYVHSLRQGQFDGLMAMGVMPHVENDDLAIKNMASLVRPGGSVFIEFRNKLFSLFTFNRNTAEFICNDLLAGVNQKVIDEVRKEIEPRLRMDMPPVRSRVQGTDAPGYDAILSKFHNPFAVPELFYRHGFEQLELLWYHYHPAMPYLEARIPEAFRREAIALEHEPSDWRGYFLCSAFVVSAVKQA